MNSQLKKSASVLVLLALLSVGASTLSAQVTFPKKETPQGAPLKTEVTVTLLLTRDSSALYAQEWGRTFRDLGISIRTRRSVLDDKPGIEENVRGTLREVRLTGTLDRNGVIQFSNRKFARSDVARLKEWLNELKTFGAQGSPESKPLWGLSNEQFKKVFADLSEASPANIQGLTLDAAIRKLEFPGSLPIRFDIDAQKRFSQIPANDTIDYDLGKLAKGTALAIALKQYGLAFYPSRTPSGALELLVTPWEATETPWPIGWELKLSRQKTAPRYFELIPVQLSDVPLRDVLLAASKASGIPMLLDEYEVRQKKIDIDEIKVNVSKKRTTWGILIRDAIGGTGLVRKLVIDERGQPFVWITAFEPRVQSLKR